jgi:hypothetical protein
MKSDVRSWSLPGWRPASPATHAAVAVASIWVIVLSFALLERSDAGPGEMTCFGMLALMLSLAVGFLCGFDPRVVEADETAGDRCAVARRPNYRGAAQIIPFEPHLRGQLMERDESGALRSTAR